MSPARARALDGRRLSVEEFEPAEGAEHARIDQHDGRQHSPIGRAATRRLKLNKNFRTQIPSARTPAGARTMQALAYAHMTARAKSTDDAQRSSTEFATGYRHARIRFKIVQSTRACVTGAAPGTQADDLGRPHDHAFRRLRRRKSEHDDRSARRDELPKRWPRGMAGVPARRRRGRHPSPSLAHGLLRPLVRNSPASN